MCISSLDPPYFTFTSNCLLDISPWMPNRHLKLNTSKTELLIPPASTLTLDFPPDLLHSSNLLLTVFPISLNGNFILPVTQAEDLGIILDSSLSVTSYIYSIIKSCWSISKIYLESDYFSSSGLSHNDLPPGLYCPSLATLLLAPGLAALTQVYHSLIDLKVRLILLT